MGLADKTSNPLSGIGIISDLQLSYIINVPLKSLLTSLFSASRYSVFFLSTTVVFFNPIKIVMASKVLLLWLSDGSHVQLLAYRVYVHTVKQVLYSFFHHNPW